MKKSAFGRLRGWAMLAFLLVLSATTTVAKNDDDVVVLKNGDRMTGEIKGLQRGEFQIKADYMAEAVRLDWARVDRIESKSTFIISLVDGKLFTNVMRLVPSGSNEIPNFVIGASDTAMRVHQLDVIRIIPVEAGFWKRLEGSIDLGFSFTSGNDQYQAELSAQAIYRTGDHAFIASVDSGFSGQPGGDSSRRRELNLEYRKQLTPPWYAGGFLNFLSSDQQSLSLRTTAGGLLGRNLKQTENTRLSVYGGVAVSREKYFATVGTPRATNADAVAGVDFTTFRFKKADIQSRLSLFPSFTTPGRMRLQFTSDVSFKIVGDLWWGVHLYENFDNKPPVRADKNDFSISTSLGWKF